MAAEHMALQGIFSTGTIRTIRALERAFPGVNTLVTLAISVARELAAAELTAMGFCWSGCC